MSETARETAIAIVADNVGFHIIKTSQGVLQNAITAALEERDREIERLRAGGCARDQRTTQFCAEAVALRAQLDEAVRLLEVAERSLGNESPGIAGHRKQVEIRGAIATYINRVKGCEE